MLGAFLFAALTERSQCHFDGTSYAGCIEGDVRKILLVISVYRISNTLGGR